MYLRLRLKNWRSIDDAEIVFAPFTVLVGRNSTGKSNIVQALLFLQEAGRDAETAVARMGGISSIRRWSRSKPYQVSIELTVAETMEELDRKSFRHKLVLKSGSEGGWSFAKEEIVLLEDGQAVNALRRENGTAKLDLSEALRMNFKPNSWKQPMSIPETSSAMLMARTFLPIPWTRRFPSIRAIRPIVESMRQPQPPSESPRLVESATNVASAIKGMKPNAKTAVVNAMRRIVPGLKDIKVESAGRYLTLTFLQEHAPGATPRFAGTEMSDGALRALAVITAAVQMSPHEMLVVEEPEVNLHPGAAHVLYDVLRKAATRGTVLITTHSPELLDQARDDEILVCSYEDGRTLVGPLAESQRALVRDGLLSVAELMRSDELRREGSEPSVVRDAPR